jgi:hypothetical protein
VIKSIPQPTNLKSLSLLYLTRDLFLFWFDFRGLLLDGLDLLEGWEAVQRLEDALDTVLLFITRRYLVGVLAEDFL